MGPWSGSGGAEVDDSTSLCHFPKSFSISFSVSDWLNCSIDGSRLLGDDAGFGAGAFPLFIDPWSSTGGAELDDACASDDSTGLSHAPRSSSISVSVPSDRVNGSINGSGLVGDDAGFGTGASTSFIDPWSGTGGAELDNACASDDSTCLSHVPKSSSTSFSISSDPRLLNTVITSRGM
ncbi:hypothetical protein BGY98DRAFT_1004831 [Russula aff. rugulosa BPL654]|nr:hypothetical protein BGY98DRAFT_1004831 [Russula aff. rugulosa BPL654]